MGGMRQPDPDSLFDAALAVLNTADATEKARRSRWAAQRWRAGLRASTWPGDGADMPDRPARPPRPELRAPRDMPKRRGGSAGGRIALLHALAHIELNAIDLAWDMIARFGAGRPRAFLDDWVRIGDEEAKHHLLLAGRLEAYGAAYGDLPAHDGLWQAAFETRHDYLARLAVVPMVLEARGLDVTPGMIATLRRQDDDASADVLQIIHDDEIGHVATGKRWFEAACAERGLEPLPSWQRLVRQHFKGQLKPPFNESSRDAADFPADWYAPLAS